MVTFCLFVNRLHKVQWGHFYAQFKGSLQNRFHCTKKHVPLIQIFKTIYLPNTNQRKIHDLLTSRRAIINWLSCRLSLNTEHLRGQPCWSRIVYFTCTKQITVETWNLRSLYWAATSFFQWKFNDISVGPIIFKIFLGGHLSITFKNSWDISWP